MDQFKNTDFENKEINLLEINITDENSALNVIVGFI